MFLAKMGSPSGIIQQPPTDPLGKLGIELESRRSTVESNKRKIAPPWKNGLFIQRSSYC